MSVTRRTLHDAQCGAGGAIGGAEPLLSQRDPAGSEEGEVGGRGGGQPAHSYTFGEELTPAVTSDSALIWSGFLARGDLRVYF